MLWNCNGINTTGVRTDEKIARFETTFRDWEINETIPTVVLTQELYADKICRKWHELFPESVTLKKREAACYFKTHSQVRFLDAGHLQRIVDRITNRYPGSDVACVVPRIHCGILTTPQNDKILICSWHGVHRTTNENKIRQLKFMLRFVEKVRLKYECSAALVGGDYNLNEETSNEVLGTLTPEPREELGNAVLFTYENPDWRPTLIDFVIAWPEERFTLNEAGPIETNPAEDPELNLTERLFDHALIEYDFTFENGHVDR